MMRCRHLRYNLFQQRTSSAEEELCFCSRCGYSTIHVKGRPCRNFLCPVCHIPLARDQNSFHSTKLNTDTAKSKTLKYPKVNTELCTGCGSCIDVIKLASTATAEARTLGHNIFGIRIKKCTSGTLGVFSTEINSLAMAAAGANEKNAGESGVELISFQVGTHPLLTASPVNNPIIRATEDIVYKMTYS